MPTLNTSDAHAHALSVFHDTEGDEDARCDAALVAFLSHLLEEGAVTIPQAQHAVHTVASDAADAAEWLAMVGKHNRFDPMVGGDWQCLLEQPHLLDLAVQAAAGALQMDPQGYAKVSAAAQVIRAFHATTREDERVAGRAS